MRVDEKALTEILESATASINGNGEAVLSNPPPDAFGKVGGSVNASLTEYGKITADALESMGAQALEEAQAFNDFCKQRAEDIRQLASERAEQAQRYVERMARMKQFLSEA